MAEHFGEEILTRGRRRSSICPRHHEGSTRAVPQRFLTNLAAFAEVECCDIVTTGRRTGRRHEIEIWFGVLDDTMYVISGNGPGADWFRNLRADPAVTVKLDDDVHECVARVVTDPDERERVGDLMGAKFWWGGFDTRPPSILDHRHDLTGDRRGRYLEASSPNVWSGDPAIGLTCEAWCSEVPAVAIEFR